MQNVRNVTEDFKFANRGNIGSTTNWFCQGYHSYVAQRGLPEPTNTEDLKEELDKLFDFLITERFSILPDEYQEDLLRKQNSTQFGAFSFIINILKVETGLHKIDHYWMGIFIKVIMAGLQECRPPEVIVKGESIDNWEITDVLSWMFKDLDDGSDAYEGGDSAAALRDRALFKVWTALAEQGDAYAQHIC